MESRFSSLICESLNQLHDEFLVLEFLLNLLVVKYLSIYKVCRGVVDGLVDRSHRLVTGIYM